MALVHSVVGIRPGVENAGISACRFYIAAIVTRRCFPRLASFSFSGCSSAAGRRRLVLCCVESALDDAKHAITASRHADPMEASRIGSTHVLDTRTTLLVRTFQQGSTVRYRYSSHIRTGLASYPPDHIVNAGSSSPSGHHHQAIYIRPSVLPPYTVGCHSAILHMCLYSLLF